MLTVPKQMTKEHVIDIVSEKRPRKKRRRKKR